MPVISIANPKGGCGKSTTCLILSTALAQKGARVSIIDCDPNQPMKAWRSGPSQTTAKVVSDVREGQLISIIDQERAQSQFVCIDLEGTANRMVSHAIARSDLVLVPMAPTALDAKEAARAVNLVREEGLLMGRTIPFRVVFTTTSPLIPTKEERAIIQQLERTKVPVLKAHLNNRVAFQAIFSRRLTLPELKASEVNGLDAAIKNADEFAAEVVTVIRDISKKGIAA